MEDVLVVRLRAVFDAVVLISTRSYIILFLDCVCMRHSFDCLRVHLFYCLTPVSRRLKKEGECQSVSYHACRGSAMITDISVVLCCSVLTTYLFPWWMYYMCDLMVIARAPRHDRGRQSACICLLRPTCSRLISSKCPCFPARYQTTELSLPSCSLYS